MQYPRRCPLVKKKNQTQTGATYKQLKVKDLLNREINPPATQKSNRCKPHYLHQYSGYNRMMLFFTSTTISMLGLCLS